MTAKNKCKPSKALLQMAAIGIINGKVLDFGCGTGVDIAYIDKIPTVKLVSGYDPTYSPKMPRQKFDTVFCNNVLNYIKRTNERVKVIEKALKKVKKGGKLIITARKKGEINRNVTRNDRWKPYKDGYLSKDDVFQRGWDGYEITSLLNKVKVDFKDITPYVKPKYPNYAYAVLERI
jgi:SAM-dependent methyltransferase